MKDNPPSYYTEVVISKLPIKPGDSVMWYSRRHKKFIQGTIESIKFSGQSTSICYGRATVRVDYGVYSSGVTTISIDYNSLKKVSE